MTKKEFTNTIRELSHDLSKLYLGMPTPKKLLDDIYMENNCKVVERLLFFVLFAQCFLKHVSVIPGVVAEYDAKWSARGVHFVFIPVPIERDQKDQKISILKITFNA